MCVRCLQQSWPYGVDAELILQTPPQALGSLLPFSPIPPPRSKRSLDPPPPPHSLLSPSHRGHLPALTCSPPCPRVCSCPSPLNPQVGGRIWVNPGATAVPTSEHLIAEEGGDGLNPSHQSPGSGPPQASGVTMSAVADSLGHSLL